MFDPHEVANELAQAVAQVREMLAPVDEATLGYRRQLEENGWSPQAAEQMALSFHTLLLQHMRGAS